MYQNETSAHASQDMDLEPGGSKFVPSHLLFSCIFPTGLVIVISTLPKYNSSLLKLSILIQLCFFTSLESITEKKKTKTL